MMHLIENENFNLNQLKKNTLFSSKGYQDIVEFHKSLGNKETPLVKLTGLAKYLGIGDILLKDESHRFGLNAFKALGASYAMQKEIFNNPQIKYFCTATDGNHGRAVAWMAKKLEREAFIYMPKETIAARILEVEKEGANVILTDENYDVTVKLAKKCVDTGNKRSKEQYWSLVQDTAWLGYEKIPIDIMRGYFTQAYEITKQIGQEKVDILFLQTGVGSWAASIIMYILEQWSHSPFFIGVEPNSANCLFESIKTGSRLTVDNSKKTTMAGLNCGSISTVAWQILKNAIVGSISIPDRLAENAMKVLANPLPKDPIVVSGESGASGLGALIGLCETENFKKFKEKIHLNSLSKVLVISTEGATDPLNYKRVVSDNSGNQEI